MKNNIKCGVWGLATVGLLITLAWGPATSAAFAGEATTELFVAQKCNLCHSMEAFEIERKSEKMKGPDLSSVGAKHSAEWIEKYLLREEKIEGKAHKKEFGGTQKELKALVKWLAELKETPGR